MPAQTQDKRYILGLQIIRQTSQRMHCQHEIDYQQKVDYQHKAMADSPHHLLGHRVSDAHSTNQSLNHVQGHLFYF